jgi:hypothetical protein
MESSIGASAQPTLLGQQKRAAFSCRVKEHEI